MSWDEPRMPHWWLNGLIETVLDEGRLVATAPVDVSGSHPKEKARHLRNIPCYEHKDDGPYYRYPDIYMDVIDDVSRAFYVGFEPGGLSCQIIGDEPFERLRRNCHQLVDDECLRATVVYVQEHMLVRQDGERWFIDIDRHLYRHGEWLCTRGKAA